MPEIRPIRVSPLAFMSSKILAQAMRSVCGVLNTKGLHRLDDLDAASQRDERDLGVLEDRDHGHGGAGRGAADHGVHLVVLDQARGEGAGLVGVAAIVIDD